MIKRVLRRVIDEVEQAIYLLATAAMVVAVGIAAQAAAAVSDQAPVVNAFTLTPERTTASMAAVAGLIAVVIGGMALARSVRRIGPGHGRRGAIVAVVMGPIGLVVGGLIVATAKGGLGTGHGLAGGVVAMILGLTGMTLGALALARSRRVA